MPTTRTTLYIEFIAYMWMPDNVPCYSSLSIEIGKGPFQTDINPRDVDEVESYLDTHTGDYSNIRLWKAELVMTIASSPSEDTLNYPNVNWDTHTRRTDHIYTKTIKKLTPHELDEWDTLMADMTQGDDD